MCRECSGAHPGPSLSSITSGSQDPLSRTSLPPMPRSYTTRDSLNLNLNLYGLTALPCSSAPCLNKMQHPLGFSCPAALPGWRDCHYSPRPRAGIFYLLSAEQLVNSLPARLHSALTDKHNTIPYPQQTGRGSRLLAIILDFSQHARGLDTCGGLLV